MGNSCLFVRIKLLSEGKQIGLIFAARKVEKQIFIAICF